MSNRGKPPKAIDIVEYWNSQGLIETKERYWNPITDIGEPTCQACGTFNADWDIGEFIGDWSTDRNIANERWERSGLEKAHIIAHASNGSNLPKNFLILCRPCHFEFDSSVSISHESGMKHVYKWLIEQPEKRRKDKEYIIKEFITSNKTNEKMIIRGLGILQRVEEIFDENQKLRFYEVVDELRGGVNIFAKNLKENLLMNLEESLAASKIATEDQLRLDLDFFDWCRHIEETMAL
jgi:hypothetical protein